MANKVHEIAFKIAGSLAGNFSSTFKAANTAVQQYGKSLNQMNTQAAQIDKVIRLRNETGEAARTYAQARQKVAELGKQISKTAQPTQEMINEFNRAKNATTKAKNELNKKREALQKVEQAAGTTGQSLQDLIKRQEQLAKSAEKARIAQEKMAKATELQSKFKGMANNGAMGLATTAAAAAPVVYTIKAAMDFEDMRAELGKYSDEAGAIFKGIENLTGKYSKSAADMTAMAANAMQSGVAKTKDEVLELVESQTQAAVAFGMTGDAIGSAWAYIQSKMQMNVGQTKAVFDIVNKLGNETSASSEDILNVLQRQGGTVKSLTAMNEKQIAALAGAFRSASTSSEVAATSMGTFISRLTVGSTATKAQQKAFDALGLDAEDVAKRMTKSGESAEAAIQDVFARINKLSPDKRGAIIGQLFGNEAGIKAAVATLSANANMLGNNLKMVGDKANYTGSMFNEYMARANTTSEAMGILRNQITLISARIGQAMLPAVKSLATDFINIASKVAVFVEKNQGLVTTITKVIAVLLACKLAFHGVQLVVGLIGQPLMAIYRAYLYIASGALKAKVAMIAQKVAMVASKAAMIAWKVICALCTAAQWAWNVALNANPIGLVIMAIAALIGIGILLYKNWDVVKAKCVQLWAMFNEKFPHLAKIVKIYVGMVILQAKLLWAGLKWAFSAIMTYLKILWSFWSNVFKGLWNAVKVWLSGVKTIFLNAQTIFDNIIGFVKNVFTGQWGAAWQNVKNIFGAVWSSLTTVVKTPINAIIALVNGAISGINNAVSGVKIPDWVPKFGGKSFSLNIKQIPMLAKGGIATGPTLAMIGEGNESEAVLPLSKLKSMIGGGTGGGSITVNFAPVINVSGGGNVADDVQKGIEAGVKDLEKALARIQHNKQRVSFA